MLLFNGKTKFTGFAPVSRKPNLNILAMRERVAMIHGSYRSKFRQKLKLRGSIVFGHDKRAQMSHSCGI